MKDAATDEVVGSDEASVDAGLADDAATDDDLGGELAGVGRAAVGDVSGGGASANDGFSGGDVEETERTGAGVGGHNGSDGGDTAGGGGMDDSVWEDARTQRRRLAGVWLAAGSAVAAMVAVSWYQVIRLGGVAPGGDMLGHAATAEWLRTLPWWDWRGWSDWFYGGQAIGVNYPPLGHAWMRFTHPVHGQMAAVAIGLLGLLPWGAFRLARAVGHPPRAQRSAVAAVLILTAASGGMWWLLSGFHSIPTFFGSWPAMLSIVLGLFCAAWAARCERPVACGVVGGIALLFNATVIPGVAVVCAVLLAMSGASFRQGLRWAASAGTSALAVSAWWLVPFIAGWSRLVRYEIALSESWRFVGPWGACVIAVIGVLAALAARLGSRSSRGLAVAAVAGLFATVMADLFGYLRPERWLQLSILVTAVAAVGLLSNDTSRVTSIRPVRPAWVLLTVSFLIVFATITLRLEVLPLVVWLLWRPQRTWCWGGALAWAAVLLWVPFFSYISGTELTEETTHETILEVLAAQNKADEGGLLYANQLYRTTSNTLAECEIDHSPWELAAATGGRIRDVSGFYRETSSSGEFIFAVKAASSAVDESRLGSERPDWSDALEGDPEFTIDHITVAQALGVRWYVACDTDGTPSFTDLPKIVISGVIVAPQPDERVWHREAVRWWVSLAQGRSVVNLQSELVPILLSGEHDSSSYPSDQAAKGVWLRTAQDKLTVGAESAGWAWLRVPWDPYWGTDSNTPIVKGGPGHLVVWVEPGVTELRWDVPGAVDAAAVAVTGTAGLATVGLVWVNRRCGFHIKTDRCRPTTEALEEFASTVDRWALTAVSTLRHTVHRVWELMTRHR